jgi:hypothetical protein
MLIADYDDTAFRAGTLTCTFLESRSMAVENLYLFTFSLKKKKYGAIHTTKFLLKI